MDILSSIFSSQWVKLVVVFALAMIVVQVFNLIKSYLDQKKPATFFLNRYSFTPKQYFFSYHEIEFYRLLGDFISQNHPGRYDIFPKVRLLDLADTKYKINHNKIASKHVDFLIVDQTKHCTPVLAIELNGASHETEHMKERDEFVGEFFKIIKIPLVTIQNEDIHHASEGISKYL